MKTTANCIPNQGGLQNTLVDRGTFVTGGRFTMNILWSNALRIEVGGAGLSGSTPINDGVWHHVAAVYDPNGGNNKYRFYVDGSLEVQGNLTTPINTDTTTKVRIGRRIDGVNYFNGSVDEVRIWSYAKTPTQIAALINNESCFDATGLQFYYNFNHGTAGGNNVGVNTVEDQANTYDGNLNGFSYTGTASNWVYGAPVSGGTFAEQSVTSCGAWALADGTLVMESGTYVEQLEAA